MMFFSDQDRLRTAICGPSLRSPTRSTWSKSVARRSRRCLNIRLGNTIRPLWIRSVVSYRCRVSVFLHTHTRFVIYNDEKHTVFLSYLKRYSCCIRCLSTQRPTCCRIVGSMQQLSHTSLPSCPSQCNITLIFKFKLEQNN